MENANSEHWTLTRYDHSTLYAGDVVTSGTTENPNRTSGMRFTFHTNITPPNGSYKYGFVVSRGNNHVFTENNGIKDIYLYKPSNGASYYLVQDYKLVHGASINPDHSNRVTYRDSVDGGNLDPRISREIYWTGNAFGYTQVVFVCDGPVMHWKDIKVFNQPVYGWS